MKDKFIILTSKQGHEVIISVANIATIEKEPSHQYTMVNLSLPIQSNSDNSYPYYLEVKESLEDIKKILGLTREEGFVA